VLVILLPVLFLALTAAIEAPPALAAASIGGSATNVASKAATRAHFADAALYLLVRDRNRTTPVLIDRGGLRSGEGIKESLAVLKVELDSEAFEAPLAGLNRPRLAAAKCLAGHGEARAGSAGLDDGRHGAEELNVQLHVLVNNCLLAGMCSSAAVRACGRAPPGLLIRAF